MADQARIGSLDDLDRFRGQLLTLMTQVRVAVEECGMEAARQQAWLDLDRRKHWEGELWRRQRKLDAARQSLFQESIANQRGPSSFLQMQVHRAEQAVVEANGKLTAIKSWSRQFEQRSQPMVKQIEQLHTVLTIEMGRAIQFLNQAITSLEAYSHRQPISTGAGSDSTESSTPPAPAPDAALIAPVTPPQTPAQTSTPSS